jgi:hypothetical protein
MRGAVLRGRGDVRFEERGAPAIIKPTDAIVRTSATFVCGPGARDQGAAASVRRLALPNKRQEYKYGDPTSWLAAFH